MLIPRFVPLLPSCVYVYLCVDLFRQQLTLPYPTPCLGDNFILIDIEINKSYSKLVQL